MANTRNIQISTQISAADMRRIVGDLVRINRDVTQFTDDLVTALETSGNARPITANLDHLMARVHALIDQLSSLEAEARMYAYADDDESNSGGTRPL